MFSSPFKNGIPNFKGKGKGKRTEDTKVPSVPCPQCKVLGFTGDCIVCGYKRGSPGPSRAETQSFANPRTPRSTREFILPAPALQFVDRTHLSEARIPMEPISNMVDVDLESRAAAGSVSDLARRSWWTRIKDNVRPECGHVITGSLLFIGLIIVMAVLHVKYGHARPPRQL